MICSTDGSQGELYALWTDIVQNFTCRQLTFSSDRLPALDGLASRFSMILKNDQYMSGLWSNGIAEQLCWKYVNRKPNAADTRFLHDHGRCPSWSWAKLEYEVQISQSIWSDSLIDVIAAQPIDMTPALRIQGMLLVVHVPSNAVTTTNDNADRCDTACHVSFDYRYKGLLDDIVPSMDLIDVGQLHMMPILRTRFSGILVSLLLLRDATKPAGVYRRVGTVSMYDPRLKEKGEAPFNITAINAVVQRYRHSLSDDDYVTSEDFGMYVIHLY